MYIYFELLHRTWKTIFCHTNSHGVRQSHLGEPKSPWTLKWDRFSPKLSPKEAGRVTSHWVEWFFILAVTWGVYSLVFDGWLRQLLCIQKLLADTDCGSTIKHLKPNQHHGPTPPPLIPLRVRKADLMDIPHLGGPKSLSCIAVSTAYGGVHKAFFFPQILQVGSGFYPPRGKKSLHLVGAI